MKKPKINLILSKKHIILSALVLTLSLAVYLNWEYVKHNDGVLLDTPAVEAQNITTVSEDSEDSSQPQNYGEAYFAEAKLSRTKSRDEAIEAMKYMLEDASLSTTDIKHLTVEATKLARTIEKEGKIENLIKAKGFKDCMVYLEPDKIDVLVGSENLTDSEVLQIKDVILSEIAMPNEKISIIEIK